MEAWAGLWALQTSRCSGTLQGFPQRWLVTCLWAQVGFAATPWSSQREFGPEGMKLPWRQKLCLVMDHTLSSNRFLWVKSLFLSLPSQSFKAWRAFSQAAGRENAFCWRDSVDPGFIFKPHHEFSFWLCFSVRGLWSAKIFGRKELAFLPNYSKRVPIISAIWIPEGALQSLAGVCESEGWRVVFALPVNLNGFKMGCCPLRIFCIPLGGGEGYRELCVV